MKRLTLLVPALLAILMLGCATQDPVSESVVAQTEARIEQARSLNADRHSPVAFRDAQTHLETAKTAIANKKFDQARALLERSMADADLAVATSQAKKSQQAANELEENLRALEAEIR